MLTIRSDNMTEVELILSNALNKIANEEGYFTGNRPKHGLIKRYANGKELHKCKACGSYHSGKDTHKDICRAK